MLNGGSKFHLAFFGFHFRTKGERNDIAKMAFNGRATCLRQKSSRSLNCLFLKNLWVHEICLTSKQISVRLLLSATLYERNKFALRRSAFILGQRAKGTI